MTEQVSNTPLREVFKDRVTVFGKAYPDEEKSLSGQLMYWGSSVGKKGITLWDLIEAQIKYRVARHMEEGREMSPEEFIDFLFTPNPNGKVSADIVMGRLQVG